MKISFNPSIGYINEKKNINIKNSAVTNTNQYNEIQKNSLAELIGRSQTVSFGAINKFQGAIFEHTCQEKFGFGEKDVIKYNKQNGCLRHEIYDINNNLTRVEEFFPSQSSEVITTFDENGGKTVETTTPEFNDVEKYDIKNREIYLKHEDSDGSVYIKETDYKRQRCVYKEQKSSCPAEQIMVIDLKTNQSVTTGELVIDKRYDEKTNTYITENIITKQTLETEQRRSNGALQRYVQFVENSGLVQREINYHPATGGYCEQIYTGYGQNNLVKVILTSKDEKKEQVIEYKEDGKTVKSNVVYTKNRNGEVNSATILVGLTEKINYKEVYYDDYYTKTQYNDSPNVPRVEETFASKDNSIISRIIFYEDGKKKYKIEEYNNDDSFIRTTLSNRGRKLKAEYVEADGFTRIIEEFDDKTGCRSKFTCFDKRSGYSEVTSYNLETGNAIKTETYNNKKELEEQIYFREDGETPSRKRTFNFDGSYKEIIFNNDGTIKSQVEYDKYGQKKVNNSRKNWNNQQRYSYQQRRAGSTNSTYQTASTKVRIENDNDFMDRISKVISKSTEKDGKVVSLFRKSDLTDSDWERLSKLININDVQIVKNMDKTTYRNLSKQFHPDLNLDKSAEEQDKAKKLFQIIQGIYTQ